MTKLDQLQELSDLVDGLANEKTVEALVDLKDKLEDIAAFADEDDEQNLQAANEIIDNIANPTTAELLDNVASSLDSLIEKIDTLRDLDDAISNVAAYNSVVEELANNLDNAIQLKAQLDEAVADE